MSGAFVKRDDSELQEVLDLLDMEYYLDQEGIDYKSTHGTRGPQFNIRECPVCGGSEWKVYMNRETGLGNCFHGSCQTGFNKFSFIRAHSGLSGRALVEHIKALAAAQGWRPARKHSVATVNETAELRLPSSYELPIKGKNLAYLENRGISVDVARYFGLRFCHRGLFKYRSDGKDRYMDFSRRVIIPVYDLDGVLVSFQGRDITGTAERKYLFPPGFAATGSHLYNGHNAQATKRVVVGEGAFDVMAQKIAFDQEPDLRDVVPVGTFGKHLSNLAEGKDQVAKFLTLKERGIEEVTMMWDAEPQAILDAVEAGKILRSFGFRVRIAILPPGKDPNEVPAVEVRRAFYQAMPLDVSAALLLKARYVSAG